MRLLAIILAYLLDLVLADPYWMPHPVRGMGKLVKYLEKRLRRKSVPAEVLAGTVLAITVVGLVYLGSFFAIRFAEHVNRWAGFAISTVLIFTTLSTRSLDKEARSVYHSLKLGSINNARKKLALIVGRDTQTLDQDEIIRATVETVAENSVDGIISPLFYAALGGAPLAIAYKAINTLDSMVGYKNERYLYFGHFSAKLDDLANYIPARLTTLLVPLASLILRKRALSALHTILRDGKKSSSPNAGIPEAGFAGALGIELGGVNYYQQERISKPILGIEIKQREKKDIIEAINLMWVISGITFLGVVLILWYFLG